jgi:dsDNA-binding SOS-regulon protein
LSTPSLASTRTLDDSFTVMEDSTNKRKRKRDPDSVATESDWQAQFERLQAFKYQHGHCEVPKKYPGDLGVWVRKQRLDKKQRHKCLTASRISKLESLEFAWVGSRTRVTSFSEKQEAKWDGMFERLKDYKQLYGDSNVPYSYKADKKLSTWVLNQRQEFKLKPYLFEAMRPDGVTRKEKMDGLGFLWASQREIVSEEKWDDMFERLRVYKKEYNNCNVPRFYDKDERLALWVVRQRQELKNNKQLLTCVRHDGTTRKQLLDDIGFAWKLRDRLVTNPDSAEWDRMYDVLQLYKVQYGDCNVPREWKEDEELAKWAVRQRHELRHNAPIMTALRSDGTTRQDLLNEIGLVWDLRSSKKRQPKKRKKASEALLALRNTPVAPPPALPLRTTEPAMFVREGLMLRPATHQAISV